MMRFFRQKQKNKAESQPTPQDNIIAQLRDVRHQLAAAQSLFSMESNADLVEAAIYQKEALERRERHLIRQARELQMEAATLPISTTSQDRWIQ
ncbi:MAG: hypothetical protein FWE40_04105 [Oscillospiraceae bacterium]|nr:hypothetical protein [Oscillospiraceae bacterium]